ncbi:hypothetical protein [Burkholderia vietnamiensis]|uniref:hypothetical protein n=1 Tax=Burkholderia vietnamiensis TaxID=60552 RepID=UPI00158D0851|nr:hypothetical protein [Burkholderia vietnamiensis]MBR8087607.1 hypothetical protein [Burkholderia vietnamiensis]MCA8232306.1 hypothetical protein [Burkholderia vietnamiensis]MDN7820836.1 hypothetical protein [Burkholderia vietnamiensis]
MSASRKPEFSSDFLESYMHELMSMSDDEILEGCDIEAVTQRAANRIAAANREAGRKRLAAAKARVQRTIGGMRAESDMSQEEIRAYIRQAANDGRVTLAARQLSEMSDADALRLYTQLRELMDEQGDNE